MALSKILSLILSCTMLIGTQAVFAPADRVAMWGPKNSCISEQGTGYCPIFAASNDATGNPYGPISDWDVSLVTSFERVFQSKSNFNQDLSKWNTGAVTNMDKMFQNSPAFNQDLSDWDTSQVTNMQSSKCTLSPSLLATSTSVVVCC